MTAAAAGVAAFVAAFIAAFLAAWRWLRVAQRERYVPGRTTYLARLWWARRPPNPALALALLGAVAVAPFQPLAVVAGAAPAVVGPVGLPARGRRSRLAPTPRLLRLATVVAGAHVAALAVAFAAGAGPGAAGAALLAAGAFEPLVVDAALWVTAPIEHALSERFVRRAEARLRAVAPVVVAVTGSYGKTSTKGHIRHLLEGSFRVVASPASWNTRLGLARTVNEHLCDDTEVLVLEMGAWRQGRIAAMCRWVRPDIGVVTAIGPVHLGRMRSLDAIKDAKAELVASVDRVVANGDEPDVLDVVARGGATAAVLARAADLDGRLRVDVHPGNAACAVAVARLLGVADHEIEARLETLVPAKRRRTVADDDFGVTFVSQTSSSNPSAAAAALETFRSVGAGAPRRIVVTPGMVELGRLQSAENERLAARAAAHASHVVVVGYTNRRSLLRGLAGSTATVVTAPDREGALAWLERGARPGDVVWWENDLPDRYP